MASTAEGTTPVPGCPGLAVGVASPRRLARVVATGGEALFTVPIPGPLGGRRVHFQSVAVGSCVAGPRVSVDLP